MKKFNKTVSLLVFLLICNIGFAQKVDIVTLTTTAGGKTKDEAVTNALRSAIEQAFGSFISSKTEIVNDRLVKDEIVSVSSGNVKNYEILSSIILPNGNTTVSVRANISVSKLTKFSENKGVNIEYTGNVYAANIKLQELYEKNELEVIQNLNTIIANTISTCYDYSIDVTEPVNNGHTPVSGWNVGHKVCISTNKNMENIQNLIQKTLEGVSMSKDNIQTYQQINKRFYKVNIQYAKDKKNKGKGDKPMVEDVFYLRNSNSRMEFFNLMNMILSTKFRCEIDNGVYKKYLNSFMLSYAKREWCAVLSTNKIPTEKFIKEDSKESIQSFSINTAVKLKHWYDNYGGATTWNWPNGGRSSGYQWQSACFFRNLDLNEVFPFDILIDTTIVTYIDCLPVSVVEKIKEYKIKPLTKDIIDEKEKGTDKKTVEKYISEAHSLYSQAKYTEAIESYQKAVEQNPDNLAEVYYWIGSSYVKQKNYTNAIEFYKKSMDYNPSNIADVCYALGVAHESQGDMEEAIKVYNRAAYKYKSNEARKRLSEIRKMD